VIAPQQHVIVSILHRQRHRLTYARPRMQTPNDTISFRLPAEFLKLLDERAVNDGEKSVNTCARKLVVRALTDTERTELREEVTKLQEDFTKMRGDLATLGAYLLVKVAKEQPQEAEAWVREHLAP